MSPEGKIVIAGTGRAGTTLLVQLLTDLGLDTGFAPDAPIDENVRAGLERAVDEPGGPRIVKSPELSRRLGSVLARGDVVVDHVIIPIRDLDVATASRVRNTWGGLFGTNRATRQRAALATMLAQLLQTVAEYDLDHTLLWFPRFALDADYTFGKLSFLAPAIDRDSWRRALAARVDPTLIHEEPLSRAERSLTTLGTAYNRGIARPARAVRRLVYPDR
jgi:hypothetical protein